MMRIVDEDGRPERLGYGLAEIAGEMLPLSVPFLRKEIARGKLVKTMFGDRVIILKEDLDNYISSRTKSATDRIR